MEKQDRSVLSTVTENVFCQKCKVFFHKLVICTATSTSTFGQTTKSTSLSINVIFNINKEIGPGMTFDIFHWVDFYIFNFNFCNLINWVYCREVEYWESSLTQITMSQNILWWKILTFARKLKCIIHLSLSTLSRESAQERICHHPLSAMTMTPLWLYHCVILLIFNHDYWLSTISIQ